MTHDPDMDLLHGLKSDDLCTVQSLISRKYERLNAFSHLLTGQVSEAEALTQSAIKTALNTIQSYHKDYGRLDTWLHRQIIETWMQAHTHSKAKPSKREGLSFSDQFMALATFPRLCLILSYYQGIDDAEIAMMLDSTATKVKDALQKARQQLTTSLTSGTGARYVA